MKILSHTLTVKPIANYSELPSVTGLQVLPSGDLVVGQVFSRPLLQKMSWPSGEVPSSVVDLKLENELGEDTLGVVGGFKESQFGDVDMVALHEGAMPKWFRSLMGKEFSKKTGKELVDYFDAQSGSMGVQSSHLQLKIKDGKSDFNVRRYKEPGMTWDFAYLGDFVFGMCPDIFWREPYLHMQIEKRETLRKGLRGNRQLHRSEDGTFWAVTAQGRLVRFQYTETKAKPTPLKVPAFEESPCFDLSCASKTDGWLYGVSGGGRVLFRARRNPISMEEEIQQIWKSADPISALTCVDRAENSLLLVATEKASGAELYEFAIVRAEDAEEMPVVPEAKLRSSLNGLPRVSVLTFDFSQASKDVVWAAEGYFGSEMARPDKEKLRILRLSEV
jgi:hypothetical protein